MKKAAAIIMIPVLLFALLLLSGGGFIIATAFGNGKYSVYSSRFPDSEYDMNVFEAYLKTVLESEEGISVRFENPYDCDKLIKALRAKEVVVERYEGFTLTSYYSPYLRHKKTVRGQIINLQIAVNNDGNITAGTPLILGSY